MKAPFLVPPFSLSLCVPLHCNTIHANLKYHFACFMALPSGRGWGWPWGVPSPAPVAGRFFWMAKCLWRGESGSWQCWAVQVNLSHGSRGSFLDSEADRQSQSFYFTPQELFGKPGEMSFFPGEWSFLLLVLSNMGPHSWHSFLFSDPKAESQQLHWFALFVCWFW